MDIEMTCITQKLERIGFIVKFTQRIGPCDDCYDFVDTWYSPMTKKWLCERCFYNEQPESTY